MGGTSCGLTMYNKSFEELLVDLKMMYGIEISNQVLRQVYDIPIESGITTSNEYKLPDELFRIE